MGGEEQVRDEGDIHLLDSDDLLLLDSDAQLFYNREQNFSKKIVFFTRGQ